MKGVQKEWNKNNSSITLVTLISLRPSTKLKKKAYGNISVCHKQSNLTWGYKYPSHLFFGASYNLYYMTSPFYSIHKHGVQNVA